MPVVFSQQAYLLFPMKRNFSFIIAAMSFSGAMAWGQKGHDVTAYIAEQHLTPATMAAVDSLLDGRSLVYWSNWLDNASHTPEYAYTKTWHYKNVDEGQNYYDAPVEPKGNVITAIHSQIEILNNPQTPEAEATLALKILTHLVGDLHQPMHMAHLSDRGGNDTRVIYFNRDNNLHSIWDTSILESGHKWSYTEWQQQIDRPATYDEALILAGDIDNWGYDTYTLCDAIYKGSGGNLSYDYVALWTPVIEQQLLKGGLRLAHVLNTIFDPDYQK